MVGLSVGEIVGTRIGYFVTSTGIGCSMMYQDRSLDAG